MIEKMRRFVLVLFCSMLIGYTALGQGNFIYFQSENNSPFYLKINDSLRSSNANGYMILHQLEEGNYTMVIGLAKKKVPEAVFNIDIGSSGDKGFLLKKQAGELRLENIQNKKVLKPAKVAVSAGNRIRKEAVEKISVAKKEDSTNEVVATETSVTAEDKKKANEKEDKKKRYTFESMLNAVTGDQPNPDIDIAKTSDLPVQEKKSNASSPSIPEELNSQNESLAKNQENQKEQDKKDNLGSFDQLLLAENTEKKPAEPQVSKPTVSQPRERETRAVMRPMQKDKTASIVEPSKSSNLSFLGFDNLDVALDTAKNNKKQSQDSLGMDVGFNNTGEDKPKDKKKKPRKNISFDQLLAKIDTTTDSLAKKSVAKPLLGVEEKIQCEGKVSGQYFNKIKRKIASKRSGASMLHNFTRYMSENKCLTISQIKEIAYLFPSNESRLQFLKEAYPHCAEKAKFKKLAQTLTLPKYQKQLQAFIR